MTVARNRQEAVDALELVACEAPGDQWDAFVQGSPGASFCHLSGWWGILGDLLGNECLYQVAVDSEGVWEGVLPLVQVRSALFGHYLVSMPFLNYGGPLGSKKARRALSEEAVGIARLRRADLLELRIRGSEPTRPLTRVTRKVTVVLPLPGDSDALWDGVLRSKVRSQIRRPMKEGMTVRFGQEELGPFYDVFSRNMRDLGTPVLPLGFFERISEVFPGQVQFGCVYLNGTALAAGCGFIWRGEFEMTWASSLKRYSRMAPNMFLYWAFMRRMVELGVGAFNFGRCTPGSGTHRFKRQWGGGDEPLPWGQWSLRGIDRTPSQDGGVFEAATKVWSRLPLPLANRIGPLLARRLP